MYKNYIIFLVTLSLFEFSNAQTLSTSPTLIFSNDSGISSDHIASDGDGGSVNILDIDIQIFSISDVNGEMVEPLSWENSTYYNAGTWNGITAVMATGRKGMAVKSVTGAEFKLNQFQYLNWGETSNDSAINTIKGYKDGAEVAYSTFQGYNDPFLPNTITLTSAFDNVDEVQFYISAGGYAGNQIFTNHSINSIQVSSPVLSSNDFELNSKIQLYPNPSSGIFNISIEENATISVNDLLGKVIYTSKLKSGNNSIDISNYQSGIYLMNVTNENGSITKKIIKE